MEVNADITTWNWQRNEILFDNMNYTNLTKTSKTWMMNLGAHEEYAVHAPLMASAMLLFLQTRW